MYEMGSNESKWIQMTSNVSEWVQIGSTKGTFTNTCKGGLM